MSTTPKHTPGPWFYNSERLTIDTIHGVELADVRTYQVADGDIDFNARLIAAAPDLLAACKAALEAIDSCHCPEAYRRRDDGERAVKCTFCRRADQIEAAISKAEGGK